MSGKTGHLAHQLCEPNWYQARGERRWARMLAAMSLLMGLSPDLLAGTWGQENWGQMYWGDNPVSSPVTAPAIQSIVAEGDDLIVTIADYGAGADGWSVIQNFTVTCGEEGTVTSDSSPVRVTGLEPDTEYECSVIATNAVGDSPPSVRLASTEAAISGLNIVIIRAVLCASDNAPEDC
jgi:predicted RNA-binding protein with TRAM domain